MRALIQGAVLIGIMVLFYFGLSEGMSEASEIATNMHWDKILKYIYVIGGIIVTVLVGWWIWKMIKKEEVKPGHDPKHGHDDHHAPAKKTSPIWGMLFTLALVLIGISMIVGLGSWLLTLKESNIRTPASTLPAATAYYPGGCKDYTLQAGVKNHIPIGYRHFDTKVFGQPMNMYVNGKTTPIYEDGDPNTKLELGSNIQYLEVEMLGTVVSNGRYEVCFY